MKRQDDLSRRRRLNKGQCPTHGLALTQDGVWQDDGDAGPVVSCPRSDCGFQMKVRQGTKLYKALCGEE